MRGEYALKNLTMRASFSYGRLLSIRLMLCKLQWGILLTTFSPTISITLDDTTFGCSPGNAKILKGFGQRFHRFARLLYKVVRRKHFATNGSNDGFQWGKFMIYVRHWLQWKILFTMIEWLNATSKAIKGPTVFLTYPVWLISFMEWLGRSFNHFFYHSIFRLFRKF